MIRVMQRKTKGPKHGSQNRLWSHMPEGEQRQL